MARSTLKQALSEESPLQLVGTINAYTAILAKQIGFKAIYLSGAGVANAAYGLPDLGLTNLTDVAEEVYRITYVCDLPLLVDIDTGWGSVLNIARTIKTMINAGAAGVHIEDQVQSKRCGHRPKKEIVSIEEMCDRIHAAVAARFVNDFVIMARTDALANEGLEQSIERIKKYIAAGADMIFFEGATELSQYKKITEQCSVPILANITEFGVTPLFTKDELKNSGVKLILYPLSVFRAMNYAAIKTYAAIRNQGTQKHILDEMQTRGELYTALNYYEYEKLVTKD